MDYGNLKTPENVTPEVQAILDSYEARNKEIENAHRKNTGRIWLGSAISGASAHPILNVPYVGTGLGGALYELGQGITEGDKLPELAKRTGAGFAIGETVGAIPYAGKYANKLSGGKIGNAFTAGVEKLASTPLGQKVAEIAPKVEDLLMTDIKAFNPNKQTVYHGSPADFNKFDNSYIGTGEGAQAHGMGHYAAKSKDVADTRYRKRLGGYKYNNQPILPNSEENLLLDEIIKSGYNNTLNKYQNELTKFNEVIKQYENKYNPEDYKIVNELSEQLKNKINIIKNIDTANITGSTGQLYKLSIPKDDVMLREGADSYTRQPKVQKALNQLFEDTGLYKEWDEANGFNRRKKFATDETILYDIQRDLGKTPQEANDLLNNYGIKGISYNGGIDGEANVIFNPDDIEIVRKYYNQPSLYELIKKQKPFYGGVSNALYDYITGE